MRINTKLTIAFLAIALVPLAAAGLLSWAVAQRSLTDQVLDQLQTTARLQANRFQAIAEQNRQLLALVASRTQMRLSLANFLSSGDEAERARVTSILDDASASIASFVAISVLDAARTVVASTVPARIGQVIDPTHLTLGSAAIAVSDVFVPAPAGGVGLYLSGPLHLGERQIGTVLIEADPAPYRSLVHDRTGLGASGETILLVTGPDGAPMFLAPPRFAAGSSVRPLRGMVVDQAGAMRTEQDLALGSAVDYRGIDVLAAVHVLTGDSSALIVKIDRAEALAPIRQLQLLLGLLVALALSVVAPVAVLVARSITGPLRELTVAATRISGGDLTAGVTVHGKDEVGVLALGFRRMTGSLRVAHEELQAKLSELEAEVAVRRRTERELLRTEQHEQDIVDSMPSMLIGVSADGIVSHWNRAAARVTGHSAEQAQGRHFRDLLELVAGEHEAIEQAVAAGSSLLRERTAITGDNGASASPQRYYDVVVYPLTGLGAGNEATTGSRGASAPGAVIRIDDVTARVQIEETMIQTEKMMSVGGLAAGMAHEINNPLAGILQACQNIERRTSTTLAANQKTALAVGVDLQVIADYLEQRQVYEFIRGIREDGARAARIVSDMLAFSRRSNSRFARLDIGSMLDAVERLAATEYDLETRYDFRRIAVRRELDPELTSLWGDQTKIEQVLLNLVKNAAQAMAAAATESPTITIRTRKEPATAVVEIIDNGPGMDDAVRRRVFEPFFTTKEVGIGTGLGLSVCYSVIVRQHGGTLDVVSRPGSGTRFVIGLPHASGVDLDAESHGASSVGGAD